MVDQCLSLSDAHVLFDPYVMHCYRQAKILEERPPGAGQEEIQKNRIALDNYDIAVTPYVASNKIPWWILPEVLPIPRLSQSASHLSESQTVFW
ncbi:hypothetical protein RSOLAG1IB_06178 [Rhizoctonia solani AG-1 IB]|uniref:Uncharacterized protein n=1 Tax=Thanatephorus cucumeris (strain AG1-IB / isolate 7/3/14) TaxID=1108050 RepID=A0A0B7FAG4_THACB|nr:hypothetical protein RSOLAG1IB_06178 [Rhizoctonia solani AG-1 IB]